MPARRAGMEPSKATPWFQVMIRAEVGVTCPEDAQAHQSAPMEEP